MGWRDGIEEARQVFLDVLALRGCEREEAINTALEWHNRRRHLDGRYARKDDGGEYSHFHLVLPGKVARLIRTHAPEMHLEFGELVSVAVVYYFDSIGGEWPYGVHVDAENGPDFDGGDSA